MQRARGRPARLSRAQLLDAALGLFEAEGLGGVTMARIAEVVDSSPMALYRHVRSREELLEAMLETLLGRLELELPAAGPWQQNVREWMARVRAFFLAHPRIVTLLQLEPGHYLSPPWIRAVGELIPPLRVAGLSDAALARALQWISRTTLGGVLQEISAPIDDTAALIGGLGRLEGEESLRWVELLPALERLDDDRFFVLVQEETIRMLEGWLAANGAGSDGTSETASEPDQNANEEKP
jgi:AcrR family transcriptional regulator